MTLVGQPPASPALLKSFELLAQGKTADAESTIKKAALEAKAQHGSGSPELARAYGEMGRVHLRMGDFERSAKEFQHAANGPMPAETQHRRERLGLLIGYGVALGHLKRFAEAEKVLRQCIGFARNLDGAQSALAAVAQVPLADVLLRAGKTDEAAKLAVAAYDALWRLGDAQVTDAVGTRAEALKATGSADNPFNELNDLPDEMVTAAVANAMARAGRGDAGRVRAVLADLLAFVEKRFGEGHPVACDAVAAIAHHEAAAGDKGDEKIRKNAVRKALWSFAVRRVSGGLISNLEVGFEPGGTLHLAPHLTREPNAEEAAHLEAVLNEAVDDLYSRPALRA